MNSAQVMASLRSVLPCPACALHGRPGMCHRRAGGRSPRSRRSAVVLWGSSWLTSSGEFLQGVWPQAGAFSPAREVRQASRSRRNGRSAQWCPDSFAAQIVSSLALVSTPIDLRLVWCLRSGASVASALIPYGWAEWRPGTEVAADEWWFHRSPDSCRSSVSWTALSISSPRI